MKKIPLNDQKRIMTDILKYFDSICRKNNIKYSLIGGSMIGAIRHKGIIPWDDDIDVILDKENYQKIINILSKDNNEKYKLLKYGTTKDYYFPYPKLVATDTYLIEDLCFKNCKEYGLFIDIFCYNDMKKDKKIFKRIQLLNSLLSRKKLNFKKESLKQNFLRLNKNIISFLIGYKRLLKMKTKIEENNPDNKYVLSTWPVYAYEKEYQLQEDIKEYIDVAFETVNAMVFKNYDSILKTTFGNYMELPPEGERKVHSLNAYWRDKWKD